MFLLRLTRWRQLHLFLALMVDTMPAKCAVNRIKHGFPYDFCQAPRFRLLQGVPRTSFSWGIVSVVFLFLCSNGSVLSFRDVTGCCVDICEFLSVPSLKFLFSMSCGDLLPSSYACFCQPSFLTLTVLPLLRADACLTSKLCDSFPLVSFLHAFSVEQFFLTSVAQMISVIGHIFYPFFHKELKSLNV